MRAHIDTGYIRTSQVKAIIQNKLNQAIHMFGLSMYCTRWTFGPAYIFTDDVDLCREKAGN